MIEFADFGCRLPAWAPSPSPSWWPKAYGLPDPRSHGSGNPGATNMLRTGRNRRRPHSSATPSGRGGGLVGPVGHCPVRPAGLHYLAALAAFLGHLFPVFFGFKGARAWPQPWVLIALDVRLGVMHPDLAGGLRHHPGFFPCPPWYRRPGAGLWLLFIRTRPETRFLAGILATLSLLVLARHHSNIRKLISR